MVELAAEKIGWGRKLPAGHGLGIAVHRSFLTHVAVATEVSVDDDELTIHRAECAVDCGTVINPDRVRAQMEGAVIYALSFVLEGEITAAEGVIQQSNFHDYPLVRISHGPRDINVHMVDSDALPTGVGEPGVPPVAPSITNAIYAATGKRYRELPLKKFFKV